MDLFINETELNSKHILLDFFKLCHQLVQIYLIMGMNGSAVFFQIKEVPKFYYPLSSQNKLLSMNSVVVACFLSSGDDFMGSTNDLSPGWGILNFIIHSKYFSISDWLKAHAQFTITGCC